MLPNFIIIGAQKAGTSFLHLSLQEHPEIFMPSEETPFFENPDYYESSIQDFERLFDKVKNQKAIGIKRPSYLGKPECAKRIKKHTPRVKLIVILRNPVERAISAYFHQIKMGFLPVMSANKGLDLLLKKRTTKTPSITKEILEFGFYHKHLSRYFKLFNKEQILIILYDDFRKRPLSTIQMVYNFLGVTQDYKPKSLGQRPQEGVFSLIRLRFRNLRLPFLYTYNKDRTRLYPKEKNLIDRFTLSIIHAIDHTILLPIFGNRKPKINPDITKRLYCVYKNDIKKLEKLIDKNLSNWKKN